MFNPYPEKLVDEVSGIEVPNEKHKIWYEGYLDGVVEGRKKGIVEGIRMYAWWKDGAQYVGCGNRTLKEAIECFKVLK